MRSVLMVVVIIDYGLLVQNIISIVVLNQTQCVYPIGPFSQPDSNEYVILLDVIESRDYSIDQLINEDRV